VRNSFLPQILILLFLSIITFPNTIQIKLIDIYHVTARQVHISFCVNGVVELPSGHGSYSEPAAKHIVFIFTYCSGGCVTGKQKKS